MSGFLYDGAAPRGNSMPVHSCFDDTETSYPAVHPIYEQQLARIQPQADSGSGAPRGGSGAAGNAAVATERQH